jgi:type I restriction enzyme S subunit
VRILGKFVGCPYGEVRKKRNTAKKIPMERLSPFDRKINGFEVAAHAAGPKFRNGDTLLAKITP